MYDCDSVCIIVMPVNVIVSYIRGLPLETVVYKLTYKEKHVNNLKKTCTNPGKACK